MVQKKIALSGNEYKKNSSIILELFVKLVFMLFWVMAVSFFGTAIAV